ncbi:MAG: hypothetical protein MJ108_09015 [Saccharofermentans sp.]|nr:hypothetical protein [Saccharofermentans sp.]
MESTVNTESVETSAPAPSSNPAPTSQPEPVAPTIQPADLAFELEEHYSGTRETPANADVHLRWRKDSYNKDLNYKYDPYHGHASIVCTNYDTQEMTYFDKSLEDPCWIQYVLADSDFDEDYQRLCTIYSQEAENKRALVKVLDYGDGVIYGTHGEEISYVYKSYDYTKCSYFPYKRPRYNATGLINVELYMMMPVSYEGADFYVQANVLVDIKRGEYDEMLDRYKDVLCAENFEISHRDNNKCLRCLAESCLRPDGMTARWVLLAEAEQLGDRTGRTDN